MKVRFFTGKKTRKELLCSYYLHPTLKIQVYGKSGFELVLWFWRWYISMRVANNRSRGSNN